MLHGVGKGWFHTKVNKIYLILLGCAISYLHLFLSAPPPPRPSPVSQGCSIVFRPLRNTCQPHADVFTAQFSEICHH